MKIVCQMREEYDRRRRLMYNSFNEMGLDCFEPRGAFYIFPCVKSTGLDGEQFAKQLLEKKNIAVVPGIALEVANRPQSIVYIKTTEKVEKDAFMRKKREESN